MEEKVNFAIVGVFVLGLGAALIAGVLWLASGGAYRKTYDTYQTYLNESVSGLSRDAPVRYRGVEVGHVRMIALVPTHAEQVQLTLDIVHGTPIKQDTVATLRVQGLTGIGYIELSGGSASSPILHALPGEPYPVIRSRRSLTLRLEHEVTTLLANLNRTSENLNALLNENNRREFQQTLADLHVVAQTLAARSADINSGLANAARTLNNSARISTELPQLIKRLQKSADGFDRMTSEITRAGQSASAALNGANATLAGTRSDLQQATSETLPQVRQLVSQLRELARSLRRVSEEVEQNPSILLFGKPPPEPGPGE